MRYYKWAESKWNEFYAMCGLCSAPAGKYKITVKDKMQVMHSFEAEITQPAAPIIAVEVSGNPESCSATAKLTIKNVTSPLTYEWSDNTSTTNVATGLCKKSYTVHINQMNLCNYYEIVDLQNQTSLSEQTFQKTEIFPNPVHNSLNLKIPDNVGGPIKISIVNQLGQICHKAESGDIRASYDIGHLPRGLYFLRAEFGEQKITRQFMKE
jgi:hypothetical protein